MLTNFKNHSLFILILVFLSACSQNSIRTTPNLNKATSKYQTGIASFYANKYQGRQTANGERFNQKALTAAHKTLRFGTRVKVTNVKNNKSVVVRINDRGPFIKGRIIDLSKSAFSKIAKPNLGIVDVVIEILP